jgi:hypothetical protein
LIFLSQRPFNCVSFLGHRMSLLLLFSKSHFRNNKIRFLRGELDIPASSHTFQLISSHSRSRLIFLSQRPFNCVSFLGHRMSLLLLFGSRLRARGCTVTVSPLVSIFPPYAMSPTSGSSTTYTADPSIIRPTHISSELATAE